MSTQTITEFLEARIAEDEAVANAVSCGPCWETDPESYVVLHDGDGVCYDVASEAVSQHIARHDPARVLAECAAKRAVIRLHDVYSRSTEDGAVDGWCALNSVLKDLAAVYKDHDDYPPEWAL